MSAERRARTARAALLGLAWGAWAALMAGVHPALAGDTPVARLAREVAGEAATGGAWLDAWARVDPGSHVAAWALLAAVGYAAGFVAGWCGGVAPAAAGPPPARWLAGLLVGHLVGTAVARVGAEPGWWWGCAAAGAAAGAAWGWRVPPPAPAAGSRWRVVGAGAAALTALAVGAALDARLASAAGVPVLPGPWFPLVVGLGSGGRLVGTVVLAGTLLVATAGLERAAGAAPWRTRAAWVPAWGLLLAPCGPLQGVALALGLAAVARAGGGWPLRTALAVGWIAAIVAAGLSG